MLFCQYRNKYKLRMLSLVMLISDIDMGQLYRYKRYNSCNLYHNEGEEICWLVTAYYPKVERVFTIFVET